MEICGHGVHVYKEPSIISGTGAAMWSEPNTSASDNSDIITWRKQWQVNMNPAFEQDHVACKVEGSSLCSHLEPHTHNRTSTVWMSEGSQTTLLAGRQGKQSDAESRQLFSHHLHLTSDLLLVITGKSTQLRLQHRLLRSQILCWLGYYVTAQTCSREGKWRWNMSVQWVKWPATNWTV
jgi:hypothetical protein